MSFSILIPTLIVINIIYVLAFFAGSLWLGVHEQHYFLGSGKALFTLHVRGVRISAGLYLPVVSRIYIITDGHKKRLKYPWEFRDRSLLRRLGATLCGPVMLVATSIIICIVAEYIQERTIIPRSEVNHLGIYPSATAEIAGFKRGDRIVKLNGKDYEDFYELVEPSILGSRDTYYTVLRDGREINISLSTLPEGFTPDHKELFISLLVPFTILEVAPSTPAAEAGLEPGDKITHVNGQPVIKYYEIVDALNNDTTGSVNITVERTANDSMRTFTTDLTADSMVPGRNRIGIVPYEIYKTTTRRNTLIEAVTNGTFRAFSWSALNMKAFLRLFSGQLSPKRHVGAVGPVKVIDVTSNAVAHLNVIGVSMMIFAFLNFLPLPRAAFWELITLGYEGATKKQFPLHIFKILRKIALGLIIACILLIFFLDIARLFLMHG